MTSLTRRELGMLAAALSAVAASSPANAQLRSGPGAKYTTLINQDLEGFPLQMTRLTLMDVAPGTVIPRHYHPGAQEIAFVIDGALTLEVGNQGAKIIEAGNVLLIPTGIPHKPRTDPSKPARVLFLHSITDKNKPFLVEFFGGDGPE
jgi:quercetin dioxygenase-like cupin family protein